MESIVITVTRAVRAIAGFIGGLLPSPPSTDAPPPDIDGRRPDQADPTEVAMRTGRDGRGAGSMQ